MRLLFIATLALATLCAQAAPRTPFDATVLRVSDGDTLSVRPAQGGAPITIRLHGIDAPERCQPHGLQAREALARNATAMRVRVTPLARDSYDRLLARVQLRQVDLGADLVSRGHAWSYRFQRDAGPYHAQERAARARRAGLWAERDPMEPRVFRRFHGPCDSAARH